MDDHTTTELTPKAPGSMYVITSFFKRDPCTDSCRVERGKVLKMQVAWGNTCRIGVVYADGHPVARDVVRVWINREEITDFDRSFSGVLNIQFRCNKETKKCVCLRFSDGKKSVLSTPVRIVAPVHSTPLETKRKRDEEMRTTIIAQASKIRRLEHHVSLLIEKVNLLTDTVHAQQDLSSLEVGAFFDNL